jgi:hypothetical protein
VSARWLTTADEAEWREALPAARSAFGCVEFARIRERHEEGESRLLVLGDIAYPLLARSLADLGAEGRIDVSSPPFTGPLGSDDPGPLARAQAAAGVVCLFAHLHPFSGSPELAGVAEPDREIVWVDLSLDPERLWSESYSHACRKNVKRARREGVTVRAAETEADIAEFHRIYTHTMERNEAREGYFLGLDLFQEIFATMPANARFALAEHEGTVVAATLYMHDDEDVYSYLGGADAAHQAVRPTNALVDETVRWAREAGKRRLILGGGYRPGDGIFRFKASFSPQRATFRVARRVHDEAEYARLTDDWKREHDASSEPGWFPAYRAPAPERA